MELTVENNVVVISLSVDQDSGYSAAAYAMRAEAAAEDAAINRIATENAKQESVDAANIAEEAKDVVTQDRQTVEYARDEIMSKVDIAVQSAADSVNAATVATESKDYVESARAVVAAAKDETLAAESIVKNSLNGIPLDPPVPVVVDKNFQGPIIHNNSVLTNIGTLKNQATFTVFVINIKNYHRVIGEIRLLNSGPREPFNAVMVGRNADGEAVDLMPLSVDSGGRLETVDIDISRFVFLYIGFSLNGGDVLNLSLVPKENPSNAPVKAYIDKKGPSISHVENKFSLKRMGEIFSTERSELPSIHWPWIIGTGNIIDPLGKYYMYYSTDHGGNNGKIAMSYSDSLLEWTDFGVVVDSQNQLGLTSEAETPSVVFDDYSKKLRMYWQTQANMPEQERYAQATMISESTDGISWTYVKQALDIPLKLLPGNGHNGYFIPRKFSHCYIATHLMGGGAQSYSGISYSYDGLNWWTSRDNVSGQRHAVFVNDVYSGGFNESGTFTHNGSIYSVCRVGIPAHGTNAKMVNLGITELCDDLITIRGKAYILLEMEDLLNESTDIRSIRSFQDSDGSVFIIYSCNDRFFLAKLEINY